MKPGSIRFGYPHDTKNTKPRKNDNMNNSSDNTNKFDVPAFMFDSAHRSPAEGSRQLRQRAQIAIPPARPSLRFLTAGVRSSHGGHGGDGSDRQHDFVGRLPIDRVFFFSTQRPRTRAGEMAGADGGGRGSGGRVGGKEQGEADE